MQQAWTFLISSAWNNYSITGNSDISNEMLSNIHDWNKLQIKYNCCYKVCTNCDKLCQQQPSFWVVYVIMCMCEMTAIQSTAMWNFLLEMNRNKTQYMQTHNNSKTWWLYYKIMLIYKSYLDKFFRQFSYLSENGKKLVSDDQKAKSCLLV